MDTLRFPALSDDQSFGIADFNQEFTFMAYPTPGSANSQGVSKPVTEKHSSDLPSIMELLPNYPNPLTRPRKFNSSNPKQLGRAKDL